MTSCGRWSALLLTAVSVVACTTQPAASPPTSSPPIDPPAEQSAETAALAAYEQFWDVTDAARADPGARDWEPEIAEVASGQALESILGDVRAYAAAPAHVEGEMLRDPMVVAATADRVSILDCLEIGDSRLVSDTTGEVFDDIESQVPRYRFRADVTLDASGRWLVETAMATLEEPC